MIKRFVLLHENLPGAKPREIIVNLDRIKSIVANHFFGDRTGSLLSFGNEEDEIIVIESFEDIRENIPL